MTWFSHEACTGGWTSVAVNQPVFIRSMERCPLWDEPLSTTQKTLVAEA